MLIKRQLSIIIVFMLITSVWPILCKKDDKKHETIDYSVYSEEMIRFDLNVQKGKYQFMRQKDELPFENNHPNNKGNCKDIEFWNKCKVINLDNINLKYGRYIFTKEEEYIYTKIDGEFGWLKCKVPIDKKYKNYIRKFFIPKEEYVEEISFIDILPFNDEKFVLIFDGSEQYILDLESQKVTWVRGNYYESPHINFKTDMLQCGGDLSSTTYIFNKFGELVDEYN
ncbi:hypothetical protein OW763_10180 [Clostridium aestuarii]|uniref:Uncharacterized protein n=1 Tax=Clostridium aestuarii TaxID=338193 RepID=A0ABT4D0D9_9CLOT|nr:hypothetical protein [Clostridium aestuarii]MCY6484708.1 hypothetical protein [Clostridium aestuarii]